jgi:alanine racemase
MPSYSGRVARLDIDSAALSHNLQRVRHYAPASKVMAVIKANGYGHDLLTVARALHAADAFAVAMVGEARRLRAAGCEHPLIVLHGYADAAELAECAALRVSPVIHRSAQIDLLEQYRGAALEVWLKLDSGMHRLGLSATEIVVGWQRLKALKCVSQVHLLSHFANADIVGNELNNIQLKELVKVKDSFNADASMANSAALLSLPHSHFEWVRPGIMLYGCSPFAARPAVEFGLKPAMRFSSNLLDVKQLSTGDSVGYGSQWLCEKATRVGYIAAGYGDGYPRHARAGTPVLVNGARCALIGRVSMDSISVDLGEHAAQPGDAVELWGSEIAVAEVARAAETITYELLCQAGAANGVK